MRSNINTSLCFVAKMKMINEAYLVWGLQLKLWTISLKEAYNDLAFLKIASKCKEDFLYLDQMATKVFC